MKSAKFLGSISKAANQAMPAAATGPVDPRELDANLLFGRSQWYYDKCPKTVPIPAITTALRRIPNWKSQGPNIEWYYHYRENPKDPTLMSFTVESASKTKIIILTRHDAKNRYVWYHEFGHAIQDHLDPVLVAQCVALAKKKMSWFNQRLVIGATVYNMVRHANRGGVNVEREIWATLCERHWLNQSLVELPTLKPLLNALLGDSVV